MNISDDQISSIVNRVVSQLATDMSEGVSQEVKPALTPKPIAAPNRFLGCFNDVDSAIEAARIAFEEYKLTPISVRVKIISGIRKICHENLHQLADLALKETGLGRYEDKLAKNALAIDKTPGVEDIEPWAKTGDHGLTLTERCPFGVIGSITPCTNPSETIINNGISMVAGGNSVCFHPHPSAKKTSIFTIDIMNKAVITAGGPPNLFTTVATPTIKSAGYLMKHPGIKLLCVTGGPAVVGAAMNSGKRVVAAGPGNPPVIVDETADIEMAAKEIVRSASCDNNIICVIEKEIIVVKTVADQLKKAMVKYGAVELGQYQARRLQKVILDDENHTIKEFVGKDVQVILKAIGLDVDESKRLAITETKGDHPFATTELLMPVVPIIRVENVDEAIELAYKLEKNNFHTASMWSKNIDNLHKAAVKMNTSIFVKNGPCLAGLGLEAEDCTSFTIASPTGEGLTTARSFTRLRRCVMKGAFGNL